MIENMEKRIVCVRTLLPHSLRECSKCIRLPCTRRSAFVCTSACVLRTDLLTATDDPLH